MPHPRTKIRLLATGAAALAGATAFAIPAPAQAPQQTNVTAEDAHRIVPVGPPHLAIHNRPSGPFVPVVGKLDYGTAENAFGAARSGHAHAGHDMFAPAGTPLVAAADAVVIDAGSDGGQGNYVHLYDPRREQTYIYMHMVAPAKVAKGDRVRAGEQLGGLGCTGSCYGDHLHFEIRDGKGFTAEARDPLPDLKDWETLDRPL
jgi:murein DD-endopeptidase MepM/ murein hydrolase activator NlpD